MPPMRQTCGTAKDRPISSIEQTTQQNYQFPSNHHLLVTTPKHIFAWDAQGTHTLFKSSSRGIVAARAAKDGSGILAVASSNVIVMHNTRRGKEESWGLNAPQQELRHLEYSPDSKSLFLSTTSDGTIQCFCTETCRMMDPVQRHEATPVALAVSSTGHLLLSASHNPPVVYLKSLSLNASALHIQPTASHAPVSSAAFHPERPNIFLLAFGDGTVAAYDASKMLRGNNSTYPDQQGVNDGEISRIGNVHRPLLSPSKSAVVGPIAGAAFLPGFKTRAVTAGRDGKCKLIDFAKGGIKLSTWHAKAPLTSLAVLSLKVDLTERAEQTATFKSPRIRSSGPHTIGGPTSTNNVIAVSRVDGQIHLYDSVGLLLAKKNLNTEEERILSLEWVKGPSPRSRVNQNAQQEPGDPVSVSITRAASQTRLKPRYEQPGSVSHLELQPVLKATPSRPFTHHPDELEEGTVRHTPAENPEKLGHLAGGQYLDLFSPVKPAPGAMTGGPQSRLANPPRNRPRISSQTFIQDTSEKPWPEPRPSCLDQSLALSPAPGSHAINSSCTQKRKYGEQRRVLMSNHKDGTEPLAVARSKRQISCSPIGHGSNKVNEDWLARSRENAKVVAEMRKLAGHNCIPGRHGTLSSFTASQRRRLGLNKELTPKERSNKTTIGKGCTIESSKQVHIHDPSTWPTDSVSAPSMADEDIWLTSEPDEDQSTQRRRHMRRPDRPIVQQTAPSRQEVKPKLNASRKSHVEGLVVTSALGDADGSIDEEAFATAHTHPSPESAFSPASESVRELYPRTSSLFPRKHHRSSPRNSPRRQTSLTALAVNAAVGRQPKSPWARLRSGKPAKPGQVYRDPPAASSAPPKSEASVCRTCPDTKARVQRLEGEVTQLKVEVLALKATLRRNGLSLPACLH